MHPLTMFLKIAAEAARASTPPGSTVNEVANGIKQGVALLDCLTADTPAKQAQAMGALLSESAYANSASEKERYALTIGNAVCWLSKARSMFRLLTSQGKPIRLPLLHHRGSSSTKTRALNSQLSYNVLCARDKSSNAKQRKNNVHGDFADNRSLRKKIARLLN